MTSIERDFLVEEYRVASKGLLLERVSRRLTALPADHVLIEICAISLNYRDLLYLDDVPRAVGLIPCSDAAGIVRAVGEEVTDWTCGERVVVSFFTAWGSGPYDPAYRASALGGSLPGVCATHCVVPARALVRIPASLSFAQAATLPCAGVTAWNAIIGRGGVRAGEVVVTQGSGGVSLFALQFASAAGAEVIALSGSDEKLQRIADLGARYGVQYRRNPEWHTEVLEYTGGRGVDHVVEVVGNRNLSHSVKALRGHGVISYVGCLEGFEGRFDPLELMYKNGDLRAIYVGSCADLEATVAFVTQHSIEPVIDSAQFTFEQVAAAFEHLRSGAHFGKVVVTVLNEF